MDNLRFDVQLKGVDKLGDLSASRVIFHGINKSGSLAMADVLKDSYFEAGRANQFVSTYHKFPADQSEMIRLINNTRIGHCFFVGHYLYGQIDEQSDTKVWVSQFRHPLPRIVSCYQWIKNRHLRDGGNNFPTLEEFIRKSKGKRHSQIAQFAPGGIKDANLNSFSRRDLLDFALETMEAQLHWFGIAEYFEESIFVLAHLCGLKSVCQWKKDVRNDNRPLVRELPPSTVAMIEDIFRFDLDLYKRAVNLFQARIQAIDFGPSMAAYQQSSVIEYKERII
jgi:hypothetical protein